MIAGADRLRARANFCFPIVSAGLYLSVRVPARRLRQALDQLGEMDREVLLMRNFENLSYQEISHLLDIDAAAARKRHGRALIRLHKILSEGGLTESNL